MPEQRRRGPLVAFVVVAFVACLALGWWQWQRFEATGGSFQNLGYAFQWPLFAVFVVYAYRRFVVLERNPRPAPRPDPEPDLLPARPAQATAHDDTDHDDETTAYNAYLAELAARDSRNR